MMLFTQKMPAILSLLLITAAMNGAADPIKHAANHKTPSPELVATFAAIQSIHQLAAETAAELKKSCGTWLQLGVEGWPGSNPYYEQTEQGLFLLAESRPKSLCTPWGQVEVYGGGCGFLEEFRTAFKLFSKRLELKFIENRGEHSREKEKIFYLDGQEISREELDKHRGTDAHISFPYCGYPSVYQVVAIDGKPLPKAIIKESHADYIPYDRCKKDWETMMQHYQEQKLQGSSKDKA